MTAQLTIIPTIGGIVNAPKNRDGDIDIEIDETIEVDVTIEIDEVETGEVEIEIPTECPLIDPMDRTINLECPWDCTKYFACSNGDKILMECPLLDDEGNRLYFNPKLQVCDWPEDAGCRINKKPWERSGKPKTLIKN